MARKTGKLVGTIDVSELGYIDDIFMVNEYLVVRHETSEGSSVKLSYFTVRMVSHFAEYVPKIFSN